MFWRGLFGRKTAPLPETAPQNKTLAIIDAAYLTSIAHKVDITRLNGVIEHIAGEKPYNTVWFTSFAPSGNDVGFVEALKRGGIEVVQYHHGARTSKCTKCGHVDEFIVQKGVDVGIAIRVMNELYSDSFSRLVFIAGDGDFSELLSIVRKKGKEVVLIGTRRTTSKFLIAAVGGFVEFSEHFLRICTYGRLDTNDFKHWIGIQKSNLLRKNAAETAA